MIDITNSTMYTTMAEKSKSLYIEMREKKNKGDSVQMIDVQDKNIQELLRNKLIVEVFERFAYVVTDASLHNYLILQELNTASKILSIVNAINSNNNKEQEKPERLKKSKEQRNVEYKKIVELYEQILVPPLSEVLDLTVMRKRHLKAISADLLPSLADWERYFKIVSRSDFLMGRAEARDGRAYLASFDWLITRRNVVKVLEQKYHNRRGNK